MKKSLNYLSSFLLIVLLITLIPNESFSQKKGEFSILAGYQMLGSVQVYNYNYNGFQNVDGDLDIKDAVYYSAAIGINTSRETFAEIQYIYQPTSVTFDPYNFGSSTSFDADVHYILGTGYYVKQFSRTGSGYFGLSIGAAGISSHKMIWTQHGDLRLDLTLGMKFLIK